MTRQIRRYGYYVRALWQFTACHKLLNCHKLLYTNLGKKQLLMRITDVIVFEATNYFKRLETVYVNDVTIAMIQGQITSYVLIVRSKFKFGKLNCNLEQRLGIKILFLGFQLAYRCSYFVVEYSQALSRLLKVTGTEGRFVIRKVQHVFFRASAGSGPDRKP